MVDRLVQLLVFWVMTLVHWQMGISVLEKHSACHLQYERLCGKGEKSRIGQSEPGMKEKR
jgi:hypothetical protein